MAVVPRGLEANGLRAGLAGRPRAKIKSRGRPAGRLDQEAFPTLWISGFPGRVIHFSFRSNLDTQHQMKRSPFAALPRQATRRPA